MFVQNLKFHRIEDVAAVSYGRRIELQDLPSVRISLRRTGAANLRNKFWERHYRCTVRSSVVRGLRCRVGRR
jgi:hypothetical protein